MNNKYFTSIALISALALSSCAGADTSSSSTAVESTSSAPTTSLPASSTADDSSENSAIKDNWYIDYFVDEFGDPVPNMPYVRSHTSIGTFSDSAANDELLSVYMIVTQYISFCLYKYGRLRVDNPYSHDVEYNVVVKYESGNKSTYTGVIYGSGSQVFLDVEGGAEVYEHLRNGEEIKVYMENAERPVCTYLFTIPGEGFADTYDEYQELKKE